jgi:hypothetical protein
MKTHAFLREQRQKAATPRGYEAFRLRKREVRNGDGRELEQNSDDDSRDEHVHVLAAYKSQNFGRISVDRNGTASALAGASKKFVPGSC